MTDLFQQGLTPALLQIAISYFFVLIILLIVHRNRLALEKTVLIASVRMTIQLLLSGLLLTLIFKQPNMLISIGVLLLMQAFCVYTIVKKYKPISRTMIKIIALAIFVGTTSCVLFFTIFVLQSPVWYEPAQFLPVGGMLIGNSMTGVNLGVTALFDGMADNRQVLEEKLILGANMEQATRSICHKAFRQATTPTLNSMMGIGIVFLPGMMTGQILGGASPITAVSYQTAIMLAILASVTISSSIVIALGHKSFFNDRCQLHYTDE